MEFCKAFNAKTQSQAGTILPVVITVYSDRSFTFIVKSPPYFLIKKYAKIEKARVSRQRTKSGRFLKTISCEISRRSRWKI